MNEAKSPEQPGIPGSLKTWQIIELVLLFLLIPGTFGLSIILNGDDSRNKVFHAYMMFVLPSLVFLLLLKIVVTIAFFKRKKWALSFNYIESIVLMVFFAAQIILIIVGSFAVEKLSLFQSISSLIFPVLFVWLFWSLAKKYKKIIKAGFIPEQ